MRYCREGIVEQQGHKYNICTVVQYQNCSMINNGGVVVGDVVQPPASEEGA